MNPPVVKYSLIDSESKLKELVEYLEGFERIAIDTEADSLHSYYEKICLVQLSFDDRNYILDPLLPFSVEPLLDAISKKTLILHGADYDLRMLKQSYGYEHKGKLFDTMIAAQVLGYDQLGLASLIEKLFSVVIGKEMQKSDWSARPLSDHQLAYAALDTHYLLEISDFLLDQLAQIGRDDWFYQNCESLIASIYTEKPKEKLPDDVWRVKGYQDLIPDQLRFLRAIWHWREAMAKDEDVPPFRIMRTEMMIRLARWTQSNQGRNIKRCKSIPRSVKEVGIEKLQEAVYTAEQLPESEWPSRYKKRTRKEYIPENKKIVAQLREECAKVAEEHDLPLSVIASRAKLAKISKVLPASRAELETEIGLLPWQADLLYKPIMKVLKKVKKK